jgi:hypothetical protein
MGVAGNSLILRSRDGTNFGAKRSGFQSCIEELVAGVEEADFDLLVEGLRVAILARRWSELGAMESRQSRKTNLKWLTKHRKQAPSLMLTREKKGFALLNT